MSQPTWSRIRKFFNDVHLWLGLSSGLVVIAICFSGTIYVWNAELTEWSAPHLYKVKAIGSARMPVDALIERVEASSGTKVVTAMIPGGLDRTYQFNTKRANDTGRSRPVTFFIDPYTGAVMGTSKETTGTKTFLSTMFSLHRYLCLDRVGRSELGSTINGWATIVFTLGCITGLIIWFPRRVRYWRQGLKIKWSGGWKRKNHDLHSTLAFYSLLVLLLMGLTGPFFSFTWYRTGLQRALGTYKAPAPATGEKKDTSGTAGLQIPKLLTVDEYLRVADAQLAYEGDYIFSFPVNKANIITIAKNRRGFFAPAAADRLMLDAATGEIKKKEIFRDKPFNERVSGSIKALHVGNIYGTFTKIIYFLACLIATSLPVTGTLIWWNKLKKKNGEVLS
jgi:uncharacterized iron-regulated membrane protein